MMAKIRIHFPDDSMAINGVSVRIPLCGSNGYKYAEEWTGVDCTKCITKQGKKNATARDTQLGRTVALIDEQRRMES